jgi:ribosomal protein L3 glutamine methyltransferase
VSAATRPGGTPASIAGLFAQTVRALARVRLSYGHGTLNAQEEAISLLMYALRLRKWPPGDVTLQRRPTPAETSDLHKLVQTRIQKRIPAAYLTHEAWLQNWRFYVDERVIVPRSYIAELLCQQLQPWLITPQRVRRALDLCTGSGCLAIILAKMFPRANVDAIDLSAPALAVAQRNVTRYRLQKRIRLVESDLFASAGEKRYDLIISNPPYVTTAVMRRLPPEYRHEPAMALAGGNDGFDLVDTILHDAAHHLTPNGMLVVEIGHHRKRLEAAYPRLPFIWPETSGGDDCVFALSRADLLVPGALQRRPAQRQARQ